MKKILLFALVAAALQPQAQNIGMGTQTPQRFVHIVDSASHTNVLIESPATSLDKDVSLELKQALGASDWLRIKKYSFLSSETLSGVSLTGASTIFSGFDAGDLKIGSLYNNGQVDLFAGGQRRMVIGATGNVGIGTGAVPAAPLHILSPSYEALRIQGPNAAQTFYNNSNYVGYLQAYQTIMSLAADGTNRLGLFTQQSERLTILPNGNIGIRNSNPGYALDVTGNVNITGALFSNGAAGTTGQVLVSNGTGIAPGWVNPMAKLYNNTYHIEQSADLSIPGGGNYDIPGLTHTFTATGNVKVLVTAYFQGVGSFDRIMLSVDGVIKRVIPNTSVPAACSVVVPLAAGSHTLKMVFTSGGSPTTLYRKPYPAFDDINNMDIVILEQ